MKGIEAASASEVRENEVVAVKLNGRAILLTRVGAEFYAVENKCPHMNLPLGKGAVADGAITCPFHGSKFDLCSGANLDWVAALGGKLPLPMWSRKLVAMGRAPAPLQTFRVREEQGKLFVEL